MDKDYLVLKRASASRSSGEWNDDDFDALADGGVGRIFKLHAAPEGFALDVDARLWAVEALGRKHGTSPGSGGPLSIRSAVRARRPKGARRGSRPATVYSSSKSGSSTTGSE